VLTLANLYFLKESCTPSPFTVTVLLVALHDEEAYFIQLLGIWFKSIYQTLQPRIWFILY